LIGFLHTAQQHVDTFDGLLAQHSPMTPREHLVRADLLEHIRTCGDTPALRQDVFDAIQTLARAAEVIVCTCSSLGAIAENLDMSVPVLRVDRALAEAAGQCKRVLVLVTLESTQAPTSSLFTDTNRHANNQAVIDIQLCEGAWEAFARGDLETYAQRIADAAQKHCQKHPYDVIALAQASMAVALNQPNFPDLPALTSPPLGIQTALKHLKNTTNKNITYNHTTKESSC